MLGICSAGAAETILSSSNLPIIIIDTKGQSIYDDIRTLADMGIIDNGSDQRNQIGDPFTTYNGRIAIELRGSSSMAYPKKSFRFETQDSLGENRNVSLLGMPAENDWILYGPYNDETLIRNVLAYRLSIAIGRYASRCRFCELVLNDDYRGLYILMEKIKRDKNRVDVDILNDTEISGDDLSGGYIIKIDKTNGENIGLWYSSHDILYQYHYPKADDIAPEQKAYIQDFVDEFEDRMASVSYADPVNGYPAVIDVPSFVDHFLLNEFARNIDAYRLSSFLSKDKDSDGGLLHAGPIWDFNLAFGDAWYANDRDIYKGWEVDHDQRLPYDYPKIPFFWKKLARDSLFATHCRERWSELRNDVLDKEQLNLRIDQLIDTLHEARNRNSLRWQEMGGENNYTREISRLRQWISNRIDWIDANINNLESTAIGSDTAPLSPSFQLAQNYPNPFNAGTVIRFRLPQPASVTLTIYNLRGKGVRQMASGKYNSGDYILEWDGRDHAGRSLPSGIYIYELQTPFFVQNKKMVLLR